MRQQTTRLALLAVVLSTIGCDQASKYVAAAHLMNLPRRSFLGDWLRLEYAENTGAFLGLGADLPTWARTMIFSVGTGLILLACVVAGLRRGRSEASRLALALVFAGGISNLFDRLAHGAVVDFLNIGVGSLRTGIFNVADMAILLGVGLFLYCDGQSADRRRAAG